MAAAANGRRWGWDGPRIMREAGLVLATALLLSLLAWAVRPDRLPLRADPEYYELELAAPLIQPDEALLLYDEGMHLFVDTRALSGGPTIPGAFRLREATLDDDLLENFDFLRPEDPLVLFGDGDLAGASNVAGRLADRGFSDLRIMGGGLSAWVAAGGETTGGAP